MINRIKLTLAAWKHGQLSPRAEHNSSSQEDYPLQSASQLDNFHLRTPHRLSASASATEVSQSQTPTRTSSAFSDDNHRRWKVVCYAQGRRDVPHTFQATALAFTPFIFIIAFIASLRLQTKETPQDEKK
jgi:hypothetical protein